MKFNREKLAALFGCSLRNIDAMRRQGLPGTAPRAPGDQWEFDSAEVLAWVKARERNAAIGEIANSPVTGTGESFIEAQRRKECALASLRELEFTQKSGRLVTLEDVERVWNQLTQTLRARLLSLPTKLGPSLAMESSTQKCVALIQAELHAALEEIATSHISPSTAE